MGVQNSYEVGHKALLPGQLAEAVGAEIVSRVASAAVGFGLAVVRMADQTARVANATSQAFLGVSHRSVARNADGSQVTQYEDGEMVEIAQKGVIGVVVEEAVSAGQPVCFRHTGAGTIGAFRNDVDGGDATLIVGATFESDAGAGEVAKLRMPYAN